MDRGIYAASSGGLSSLRLLQVVSNNLANSSTVGYKAERVVSRQQEFADTLAGTLADTLPRAKGDQERTPGVTDIATMTDFTPGPISETGNPLDAALSTPNQFFAVQGPGGEQYTRAGSLKVDSNGFLVTPDGLPVLGEGGPIAVPPQGAPKLTSNGTVMIDKTIIGRLRVVEVSDLTQLQRQGGTRFSLAGGAQATSILDATIVPEAVEMPNISVVQSMVDMISAHRAFESYAKSVRTISELDDTALRGVRSSG